MTVTSLDPDGPSKLAIRIDDCCPKDIYIQQNKRRRIRITAVTPNSGKSIWLTEHEHGIELTLAGSNIRRYSALVMHVLDRVHDTEYDNGKMCYLNWRDVNPSPLEKIVTRMADY